MYSSANWNIGWRVRWLKKITSLTSIGSEKQLSQSQRWNAPQKSYCLPGRCRDVNTRHHKSTARGRWLVFLFFFQSGELTRWWQKQIINHFVFAHRINLKPLTVLILPCLWFEMFTSCHNRQNTALQHTRFCGAACVVVLQQPCCLLHAIRSRRVNAANGVS